MKKQLTPLKWISENVTEGNLKRLLEVIVISILDFTNDNGTQWAAAVAYYALLSIFPLLLAAASIASFFVDASFVIDQLVRLIGEFIPRGATFIQDTVMSAYDARQSVGIISVLSLLWTGSRVFGVVTKSLNIAYDVDDRYPFLKRTLIEIVMLFTIGGLFLIALISQPLISLLSNVFEILPKGNLLLQIGLDLAPVLILFVGLFLLYRYVPRRRIHWRAAVSGAILATLLVNIAQPIFVNYLNRFAEYNLIYGSMAIAIILILWAWIFSVILLFGGEIASHVHEIFIEENPTQEVVRRHLERSPLRKK